MEPPPDAPAFTTIDWESYDRSRTRLTAERLAVLCGTVAVVALALYDRSLEGYLVLEWLPRTIDWVILWGGVLLFAYAGIPAIRHGDQTKRVIGRLLSRPTTAGATLFLGFVGALAVFGPWLTGSPPLQFQYSFHPPAGGSIPAAAVGECLGTTSDIPGSIHRNCHGTIWAYPFGANADGIAMEFLVAGGARTALYVAVFTVAFVVPVAAAVGVIAGMYGGLVDDLLMGYVDVQLSIPAIILYVIGYMYWNPSLLLLLVTFGLLSWGGIARLVRSEVLQRREAGFVMVARSLGGSSGYVARRHVLPNITNTLIPAVFQLVGLLILVEAGIAFLGFQEPYVYSWGNVIANGVLGGSLPEIVIDGGPASPHHIWWVATFPALALALTLISCKLVGDALRDALDPRRLRT